MKAGIDSGKTWFAIRTRPGAQMPQREYALEKVAGNPGVPARGKGYRIVPSLNPRMSAVERALSDAGFVHYMPADFKVIRDRKKTGSYCIRRYPLLPGYVFVTNCSGIKDVPGVAAIIGTKNDPLPIDIADILALRTIEAKCQAEADRELAQRVSTTRNKANKAAAKALAAAKRKLNEGKAIKILWGKSAGREATLVGWEDGTRVRAILHSLDCAETVSVAFEDVRLLKDTDPLAA